jgi:hypothetical protein
MMGMKGEEVVCDDNLVWITKSHYPMGFKSPAKFRRGFNANKMIVVARNPIDILPSKASLDICCSHSLVPE